MKKKKIKSLDEVLTHNYPNRQEDLCNTWNEIHNTNSKTNQQNGIVYTPQEVVDFIINSVAYLTKKEFGIELNEVQVLDPFAGTGIFGARMADLGYSIDNLICYEIDPETAKIANKNISVSSGKEYNGCITKDTFMEFEQ